ncbi:alanyl-tRNA editing protein [Rhodopseudomonas palustris]|uniref:Alanine--tRNA ligase n=1 Tax=Rhodopseudomonas palustris TaxID=1076 RepID=A0A323UC70_RHOPL|nr:alanyl-tRNA editing protein [Rhodopseudomonas palustris]PZA09869.1 alanyl-tRNA editing protein [Rhodopseudomonas palustris]
MTIVPTIKLFETDAHIRELETTIVDQSDAGVCLEKTIFYAESGGQPGDVGELVLDGGVPLRVVNTQYIPGRLRIAHVLATPPDRSLIGAKVLARIDWERRYRLMRLHTSLHLMCSLVDAPVTGCAIYPDYARLDFDIEGPLDRQLLTDRLNALIGKDLPVEIQYRSADEMSAMPSLVRTVQAAPPQTGNQLRLVSIGDIDRQPCGGTHVRSTGEIVSLAVTSVEKKGRHNRRVKIALTALTGRSTETAG